MSVLTRERWAAHAAAHRARLAPYVEGHLERRRRGESHPVHDFLFTYYNHRPAQLLQWHPGYGVVLEDAPEQASWKGYAGPPTTVSPAFLHSRRPLLEQLHLLLAATASRAPTLGCFGLHEWAMVHRSDQHGTRHPAPLRLGQAGTDAVVENSRITCSHFDAYRFFTPSAVALNQLRPGRDDRRAFEQPGCLHAGMDLYKHAYRLSPLIDSDLVADCFELAWDIRVLDMRAAPYDFASVRLDPTGEEWSPIRIETAEGRAAYVSAQREYAERGAPLRARLITACERLLDEARAMSQTEHASI